MFYLYSYVFITFYYVYKKNRFLGATCTSVVSLIHIFLIITWITKIFFDSDIGIIIDAHPIIARYSMMLIGFLFTFPWYYYFDEEEIKELEEKYSYLQKNKFKGILISTVILAILIPFQIIFKYFYPN